MSTGTVERPKTGARMKGSRPKVLHYVTHPDIEFGRAVGVQVKALCGRWIHPYQPGGSGAATGNPSGGWTVCKNCLKARERRS
ncbi:DUF3039 domain-containing protein [Acidipropionibacterium acidipropionici]|uniref:DUF3039 domain-containing protein n=1 Tax=Acidipropionibacterium acidipropionici TaxID=1748 RepID=UPI00110B1A28|nr:DUF3039 domain-containing protein [Acidipropionibacterium acidipropionici]QCV94311.1 DUF3039 domain-containing protein [Acidipropionibacterium acidipropionici]